MAVLKCKMCGGDVKLAGDKTFGVCEYCGSNLTFPKVDDEQRAAAFNRGNHFRRIGEFDKALAVYERIVQEDDTDAEAHWCCALCRFGIEYVEDPATMEWLPTCHRASFDSFLEDVDYLAAVKYSAGITQRQYQKDAAKIADVQRGILATSQNTEPYDVFICYKETDENGNRTKDSMMAQDIYYQLTEQGRKVFFARITLEDVAGAQYEPYIFAALNSARVMIVVGTTAENLSAVWVKNEWSRFLSLMKKDHSKLLLPCYRDMDPYDLPEQLSVLQSYDMAKIGFIQDLIRGVAKVLDAEKKPTTSVVKETIVTGGGGTVAPLLKRAFMFLEDGDWASADEYCEKVLDIDPECGEAYLAKLMAELHAKTREGLKDCDAPFDQHNNYQKAVRFGDETLKAELQGYIDFITQRNYQTAYDRAVEAMENAQSEADYLAAAQRLKVFGDYADAAQLVEQCREKAEIARKDDIYHTAIELLSKEDSASMQKAIDLFASISDWKDADKQIEICQKKLEKLQEEQRRREEERAKEEALQAERQAKRVKKFFLFLGAVMVLILLWMFAIRPWIAYSNGNYRIYINRYNIKEFTVPEGVTEIKENAFYDCDSLTSVTIPDSVTTIGDGAFSACISLESVTIGNGVTSIGEDAFAHCDTLTTVTVNSQAVVNSGCFSELSSLTSVTIGNSVTTIGDRAFDYCDSLTSVTIGNGVTSIGKDAFYYCDSLTSITIPDSVTTIGDCAFYDCDSLTSVTIPDSVTTIGAYAFADCDSLTSVTIPDSVTELGQYAFFNCSSLTLVTIPDSVLSIGEDAFYGCDSLTSVNIPNSVLSIGSSVFDDCTNLKEVVIDSQAVIDRDYFSGCDALVSVTIGGNVTSVGDFAFLYCDALTSVTIFDGVTSIEGGAFWDCPALTSVTIPNSIVTLHTDTFDGCDNLTDVYYKGTIAQWEKFNVHFRHAVMVHCSDGDYKDS